MRAHELLDADVITLEGETIGKVLELLAEPRSDGNEVPTLEITRLLVGERGLLLRLGFRSREMQGPPGLRWLANMAHAYEVPAEAIGSIADGCIRINLRSNELNEI